MICIIGMVVMVQVSKMLNKLNFCKTSLSIRFQTPQLFWGREFYSHNTQGVVIF